MSGKPILALSTAWCSHRHLDGYAMLAEMADLGFDHVELSHGVRISLVPGILKALDEGVVRVSSVHNFCPLPAGVTQAAPNLFEPSSKEPRERNQWLRHTKRTIDFAAQVKAAVVVCHLGSVIFLWLNPVGEIRRYLGRHPGATPASDKKYEALLAKSVAKLRKRMPPYWEHTLAGVLQITDYARQKGLTLAFENREKFEELPLDADFPEFLAGLPAGAPAGYWHDTGHAQLKQAMGLIDHRQHLERNASRLLGFHLHDVNAEGQDHQPIGSGRVDFRMVSTFWRPEHRLTLELGPRVSANDVRSSKRRVEELMAV